MESMSKVSGYSDAIDKKIAALEAIHRVSLAISSKQDIDELLQFIVEQVAELFSTSSCSILLPDSKTGDMIFHAAIDPIVGMRVPSGKGIVFSVFQTGTPKVVNDLSTDPDYYPKIEQNSGKPIRSLLAVPLVVEKGVIGVLEAVNKQAGFFTEEDRDLFVGRTEYLREQRPHLVECSRNGLSPVLDPGQLHIDAVEPGIHQPQVEVLLAGEVVVERPLADPGRIADLRHSRRLVPSLGERLHRGFHDVLPGLLGSFLLRHFYSPLSVCSRVCRPSSGRS